MSHRKAFLFAALLGVCLGVAMANSASAIGYFNVPGNCCHWWGYGCGPGYHSCMVLGPASYCHGCCSHGVERLPCAPCPPYGHAGCSYGCGCDMGQPSMLDPNVAPIPMPAPTPEPALDPAAYRAPFRY